MPYKIRFSDLPMMQRAFHVISHREPNHSKANFCSNKGRHYALINAAIYSTRIATDPFFGLCYTLIHLFKLIYHRFSHSPNKIDLMKKDIYQLTDVGLYTFCSPFINGLLASKLLCGGLVPRVCYREASFDEKWICKSYKKHYKTASRLAHQTIVNLIDRKASVEVIKKFEKVKQDSKAAREAYYKIKLYPF